MSAEQVREGGDDGSVDRGVGGDGSDGDGGDVGGRDGLGFGESG